MALLTPRKLYLFYINNTILPTVKSANLWKSCSFKNLLKLLYYINIRFDIHLNVNGVHL